MGTAFARFYASFSRHWGVILLDASDPELHRVAAPIYRQAVEQSSEIAGHTFGSRKGAGSRRLSSASKSHVFVGLGIHACKTARARRFSVRRLETLRSL